MLLARSLNQGSDIARQHALLYRVLQSLLENYQREGDGTRASPGASGPTCDQHRRNDALDIALREILQRRASPI